MYEATLAALVASTRVLVMPMNGFTTSATLLVAEIRRSLVLLVNVEDNIVNTEERVDLMDWESESVH